ncbi:NUDIX hydrolase domain-like protein [Mycena latifolia]|nr:NUDIX hydrolase domain-like protein [Mycena latifolia]
MTAPTALSYLDLVNICGNTRFAPGGASIPSEFPSERLVPFHLSAAPESPIIGLLRPQIVDRLLSENESGHQIWDFFYTPGGSTGISFATSIDTHAKRTAAMQEMCVRWRDAGHFAELIGPTKWRGERLPVYKDPFGARDHPGDPPTEVDSEKLNFAFEMERSACALFGIVIYGVYMSMYQRVAAETLRVWTPTRASTKSRFPGYLDTTVGGGIPSGMPVFEALVKECMEEASLSEPLVRAHARSVGCISYLHRAPGGWLQPEVGYLYDLPIPAGADPAAFEPKPLDGEVASFDLLTKDALDAAMRAGRFKPNCAIVLVDLFVRLGYITPDNKPDYLKIVTALHAAFDFERWSCGM